VATPLSALGDADWDARFHVYRMDWNETSIALSVDGVPINDLRLTELSNPDARARSSIPRTLSSTSPSAVRPAATPRTSPSRCATKSTTCGCSKRAERANF